MVTTFLNSFVTSILITNGFHGNSVEMQSHHVHSHFLPLTYPRPAFWEDPKNRREYFDWVFQDIKLQTPEDWYKVSIPLPVTSNSIGYPPNDHRKGRGIVTKNCLQRKSHRCPRRYLPRNFLETMEICKFIIL
jgi:hypothetical protein